MSINSQDQAPQGIFEALWGNEQFKSGLRTALQTVGTGIASWGVIDASWVPSMVGAIMWLIPTVWGLYVRRKAGLIATTAALPEVSTIVTTARMVQAVNDTTGTVVPRAPD